MIVIRINRKLMKIAVVVVLAITIGLSVLILAHNNDKGKTAYAYSTIETVSFRLRSFLNSESFYSQGRINIEVFDVKKGSVIKRAPSNDTIQIEAEKYIEGINGMYPKVKAFPSEGYIVRIPLESPIMSQNEWLRNIVTELFVIYPGKNEKPYLLILDEKDRPVFYTFKGDAEVLLKTLDLKIRTP